jgi:hypothetical protein
MLSILALVLVGCLAGCHGKVPQQVTPDAGRVSGRVLDSQGSPVEHAAVSVAGRTACSDANGQFFIDDLKDGTYSMVTTAAGYGTAMQTARVAGGAQVVVNTPLSLTSAVRTLVDLIESAIRALETGGLPVRSITGEALERYVFDNGMEQTTLGSGVGAVVDTFSKALGLCLRAYDDAFKRLLIEASLRSVQGGGAVLGGLLQFLHEHACSPGPCAG